MFSASHARSRKLGGGIQKVFQRALAATAQHGDRVINASIGMALDDRGQLFASDVLMEELRALKPSDICSYGPIAGIPDYLVGTTRLFLGEDCELLPREQAPAGGVLLETPDTGHLICPVATLGGSSGLSLVMNNYLERGASFLTSNYFWGPYETMADARGVKMAHFELFGPNGGFNLDSFGRELRSVGGESVMVLLNDPAHNPTGYCMTGADWDGVADQLKNEARRRKVVLLLDAAYMGYYRSFEEDRLIVRRLLERRLPDNVLLIVAGSCSKAFLAYGLRVGTCIAVHRDRGVLQEFFDCLEFNIRGEYSNIARGAMQAVGNICKDSGKMGRHMQDVGRVRQTLQERYRIWGEAAHDVGLPTAPYRAGYFLVVTCDRPQDAANGLEEDLIFTVPIREGIRIAICSVTGDKLRGLPVRIAERVAARVGR